MEWGLQIAHLVDSTYSLVSHKDARGLEAMETMELYVESLLECWKQKMQEMKRQHKSVEYPFKGWEERCKRCRGMNNAKRCRGIKFAGDEESAYVP